MLWQVERVQDSDRRLAVFRIRGAMCRWRMAGSNTKKVFEGRIRAQAHDVVDNPSFVGEDLGERECEL